jgi:hypothetical protein
LNFLQMSTFISLWSDNRWFGSMVQGLLVCSLVFISLFRRSVIWSFGRTRKTKPLVATEMVGRHMVWWQWQLTATCTVGRFEWIQSTVPGPINFIRPLDQVFYDTWWAMAPTPTLFSTFPVFFAFFALKFTARTYWFRTTASLSI